jgi:hypothetical protein
MLGNEDDWWRKNQVEERAGAKPFVSVSHGVVNLRVVLLLDLEVSAGAASGVESSVKPLQHALLVS